MSSRQWRRPRRPPAPTHRVIAPPDLLRLGNNPRGPTAPLPTTTTSPRSNPPHRASAAAFNLVGLYGALLALRSHSATRRRSVAQAYDPVAWGNPPRLGRFRGPRRRRARRGACATTRAAGATSVPERFVDYWSGAGAWRALAEPASVLPARGAQRCSTRSARSSTIERPPRPTRPSRRHALRHRRSRRRPSGAWWRSSQRRCPRVVRRVAGAGHMGLLTHERRRQRSSRPHRPRRVTGGTVGARGRRRASRSTAPRGTCPDTSRRAFVDAFQNFGACSLRRRTRPVGDDRGEVPPPPPSATSGRTP